MSIYSYRSATIGSIRIARRAEQLAVRLLPSDRIGPEPVKQLVNGVSAADTGSEQN